MMAIELKQVSLVPMTDPDVQHGDEEALSAYVHDGRIRTDLDLLDAIKEMLTEIAEEGHLTERVVKHQTGFMLGILSVGK